MEHKKMKENILAGKHFSADDVPSGSFGCSRKK